MNYVNRHLMPGESVVYRAAVSPLVFLPTAVTVAFCLGWFVAARRQWVSLDASVWALVVIPLLILFALVSGARALSVWLSTEMAVTNRRVIGKVGLVSRRTLEILLPKVEGVSIRQGPVGLACGYGDVVISGTGSTHAPFRFIAHPEGLRAAVVRQSP